MSIPSLREFTSARVALGRAGAALPTDELLRLQFAHAQARESVNSKLDTKALLSDLSPLGREVITVHSAVPDRATYLQRPDRGRRLDERSRTMLQGRKKNCDAIFVLVDGLSATAVHRHAVPLLEATLQRLHHEDWRIGPLVLVEQGRVAIGDEVGSLLGASLSIVLIGERPGLSSPESLGVYLTWNPKSGINDAERNCLSNIHTNGLSYGAAAYRLAYLMTESRRRELSGVRLKEDALALE